MARFFVPFDLFEGQCYTLPEGVIRHVNVRRIRPNEQIILFNGDGYHYTAQIDHLAKKEIIVTIIKQEKSTNESPLNIILAQAISSGDRMDFALQKSVELGVTEIMPISTERSVVQLKDARAEKKVERWQEIVISACEQSGRDCVPQVNAIQSLDVFLDKLPKADVYVILSPVGCNTLSVLDSKMPFSTVCVLIGPEGGLSDMEGEKAMEKGFIPVLLGARILRTETAALAIISALQVLWGDFLI